MNPTTGRPRAAIWRRAAARRGSSAAELPTQSHPPMPAARRASSRVWIGLAVIGLLLLHYALAAQSLLQENPTIDEVVHLPAGVTYWQKGTFRLYHHNPPLVKLVAALPVVWSGVVTDAALRDRSAGRRRAPDQATFAHRFAALQRRPLLRALSARPADHAALFRARRPGRLRVVAPAVRQLGGAA